MNIICTCCQKMSSFKNAVKSLRRTHRERSQPQARKHLGLLEKHKDYVLRARNYHQKQAALKLLREKARNKNPDEFYYKMISSKIEDGRHVSLEKEERMTEAEMKLMKTQDLKYVTMKLQIEKSKIARLESGLHLTHHAATTGPKSHVVFVDSDDESDGKDENGGGTQQSSRRAVGGGKHSQDALSKDQLAQYKELKQRRGRLKELERVAAKMQTKKNLTNKHPAVKISQDGCPSTYRWRMERTR